MIEYFKRCWKGLASIVGMFAVAGSLMTVPTFVATPADLKSLETRVMDRIELDRNLQKLNNVNENLYRVKAQKRQYPQDAEIQEDYNALIEEKAKLQRTIEKR